MKRALNATIVLLGALILAAGHAVTAGAAGKSGEDLFQEHCAACHPDGGNIVNPKKTLKRKDLIANGVAGEAEIIRLMRNPGPGMLTFDANTISDNEARAIAKYILGTFGTK